MKISSQRKSLQNQIKNTLFIFTLSALHLSCGLLQERKNLGKNSEPELCTNPIQAPSSGQVSEKQLPTYKTFTLQNFVSYSKTQNEDDISTFVIRFEAGKKNKSSIAQGELLSDCVKGVTEKTQNFSPSLLPYSFITADNQATEIARLAFDISRKNKDEELFAEVTYDNDQPSVLFERLPKSFSSFQFYKLSEELFQLHLTHTNKEKKSQTIFSIDFKAEKWKQSKDQTENQTSPETVEVPADDSDNDDKAIQLTKEETELQNAALSSPGVAIDSSGNIVELKDQRAVEDYLNSSSQSYDRTAALTGLDLATHTGGNLTFADKEELPASLQRVFAAIKGQANSNSGDIDMAWIIDYSGSMDDKIGAVLAGLDQVAKSLESVTSAKRKFRIGIVTFGEPGKEKVNLPFTSDMSVVRSTLIKLLDNYNKDNHAIEPGEAWHSGMVLGLKKLQWSAANKSLITITDEGSWEVSAGKQEIIDEFEALAIKASVKTKVYSIITD